MDDIEEVFTTKLRTYTKRKSIETCKMKTDPDIM